MRTPFVRKPISFDLDGVIAEGGYTPPENRTNEFYTKKGFADPEVLPSLQWLSILYDIYILSARSHNEANLGIRAWLHFALGLELDTIAGIVSDDGRGARAEDHVMNKAGIADALGIVVHFDDHPDHVRSMPGRGVLVVSNMPSSQEAAGKVPTVYNWDQVREFLTTPGYTLHGSEGVSVVSPCEKDPYIPHVEPGVIKALADQMDRG